MPSLRRHTLLLVACCLPVPALAATGNGPTVDGERLNATLEKMRTFGGNASGGSARVAFTPANRDALHYLAGLMQAAGMTTHVDLAGNLIGARTGKENRPPLMTGSHVDTVPDGGHYDGIVGVMSAIEVATALHEAGVVLDHPLEIAVWANEEGGKNGSRSLNGSVRQSEMSLPSLGDRSLGDGIRFLGGDPDRIAENAREPGAIAAYVELHVEQGGVLDRAGVPIGVVDGIVGIRRWNVRVEGKANHAGTTPMDQRQDALFAAAHFAIAVREATASLPGAQVATIGRIQAEPGAPNVIPGTVRMSLEIRDLDMEKIGRLFERIEDAAGDIGKRTGTRFGFERFYESPAALTDPRIGRIIEAAAADLGLEFRHLPSGAGHDAQSIAPLAPIGMIFVPSRDGISHAPDEFTAPEQVADGANVLLQTLLRLDRELQ